MPQGNRGQGKCIAWIRAHADYTGDDCLTWPFAIQATGYGSFGYLGKPHYAHRYMCELVNGPPPTAKHHASHSCGRGKFGCVNRNHLSWKTPSENNRDRRKHGTQGGSIGPITDLTLEQIEEIRQCKGTEPLLKTSARMSIPRGRIEYWQNSTHRPNGL